MILSLGWKPYIEKIIRIVGIFIDQGIFFQYFLLLR